MRRKATQRSQQADRNQGSAIEPHIAQQPLLNAHIVTPEMDPSRAPLQRLIRIKSVLNRIAVSHSQLYNLMAVHGFPRPIHIAGGQASFWVESEVNEWIQSQIDAARLAA